MERIFRHLFHAIFSQGSPDPLENFYKVYLVNRKVFTCVVYAVAYLQLYIVYHNKNRFFLKEETYQEYLEYILVNLYVCIPSMGI